MTDQGHTDTGDDVYGPFAQVYAAHWEDYARLMVRWFPEVVEHFGLTAESVVDLACGTGYFAIGLATQGRTVVGIDRSERMLAVARRRARRSGAPVRWSRQDMRDAEWPEPVDLVTCWFDSLNYLIEPEDVRRTFARVHAMLGPGGAFLFDVYTVRGLEDYASFATAVEVDTPSCFVVTDTLYDRESATSRLTVHGFLRGRRRFRRFREVHQQRAYGLDDLTQWLQEAGFEDVLLFRRSGFAPADEQRFRAYGIARRGNAAQR